MVTLRVALNLAISSLKVNQTGPSDLQAATRLELLRDNLDDADEAVKPYARRAGDIKIEEFKESA